MYRERCGQIGNYVLISLSKTSEIYKKKTTKQLFRRFIIDMQWRSKTSIVALKKKTAIAFEAENTNKFWVELV